MREAHHRISQVHSQGLCHTAAFFFDAKGDSLLHSSEGLYRSLLCQLLPRRQDGLRKAVKIYIEKVAYSDRDEGAAGFWDEIELRDLFQGLFEDCSSPHTILFIDALDECEGDQLRQLAFFFRDLTESAHEAGVKLEVCLSSRHFGAVTVSNCPIIAIEHHNKSDIMLYLDQKLAAHDTGGSEAFRRLKNTIMEMSSGIFLWVVLVVDMLLKDLDEGKNERHLEGRLSKVPLALQGLFREMLSQTQEDRETTLRFFQWVILAGELRLREWHHILPYIRRPIPHSLQECRESAYFTETDEQLEKQIRHISMGLVEVTAKAEPSPWEETGSDDYSIAAGAGSLDLETGETRIVRLIHESVRQFFLHEEGFFILSPDLGHSTIGEGYVSIMDTCLDFIGIPELDGLVNARLKFPTQLDVSSKAESIQWRIACPRDSSIRSFSSASSTRSIRIRTPEPNGLVSSRRKPPTQPDASSKAESIRRGISRSRDSSIRSFSSGSFIPLSLIPRIVSWLGSSIHKPPTQPDASSKAKSTWAGSSRSRGSSIRSFSSASSIRYSQVLKYSFCNNISFSASERDTLSLHSMRSITEPEPRADHSTSEKHQSPTREMMKYRLSLLSQLEPDGPFPLPLPPPSNVTLSVSSNGVRIGVLQDYPALLPYILTTFSIHARSAEKEGANATSILLRLREGGLWKRWLCLSEMPHDIMLITWAEAKGLSSWVTHLSRT